MPVEGGEYQAYGLGASDLMSGSIVSRILYPEREELAEEHMRLMLTDRKLTREAFVRWKGYEPGPITEEFYHLMDKAGKFKPVTPTPMVGKAWNIYNEAADFEAARVENDRTKRF